MEILAHLSLGGVWPPPSAGGLLGLILDRFRGRDPPSLEPKKVHLVGSPPPSPYSPRCSECMAMPLAGVSDLGVWDFEFYWCGYGAAATSFF